MNGNRQVKESPGTDLYRADWGDYDHPSTAIVEALSEALGIGIHDLEPLQETVDGDALDALLGDGTTPLRISFEYEETFVSVESSGSITVWTE